MGCGLALALFVLILPIRNFAQNPQLQTRTGARFPTVVFSFVSWKADPSYYSIAIDSTGTATYQSAPDLVTNTGVPYTVEFHASDGTRRTTFNVTRELGYFSEPANTAVDSPQNGPVRTLAYDDVQSHNRMTYSSTSDGDLEELTSVFEEISETLEFGRRLAYFHEHDKAALNRELDDLQKRVTRRKPRELQAISLILHSIASDQRLDADVRDKAEALLKAVPLS